MAFEEQRLTPPPSEREPALFRPMEGPRTARLGRYQIIGALASGGMGTVYLCRHSGKGGFRRLYALKLIHEHLARDPESIEMLLDEARLASRIHHVNVVPILDLGVDEGRHFLVMDYVEGCSLAQLCRRHRRRRPAARIVPLIIDALDGLHAAHTLVDDDGEPLRMVHRDVSPQNVLVGVDGVGRVIDFGIATAMAGRAAAGEQMLKGKIAYMSPEQLISPEKMDARSDVFSVGVVLWTLLTGEPLFRGASDAETMKNVMQRPIPPPSERGLRPPACFDAVCLKALERRPQARFQSAEAMADALRKVALDNDLFAPRSEIAQWVGRSFENEFAARRTAIRQRMSLPAIDVRLDQLHEVESLPEITGSTSLRSGVQTRETENLAAPSRRRFLWALAPLLALAAGGGWYLTGDRETAAMNPPTAEEPATEERGNETADAPQTADPVVSAAADPAPVSNEAGEAPPPDDTVATPATPSAPPPRIAVPPSPKTQKLPPPSGKRDVGY
jgi:serine/threonine protein kinase